MLFILTQEFDTKIRNRPKGDWALWPIEEEKKKYWLYNIYIYIYIFFFFPSSWASLFENLRPPPFQLV